MKAAEEPGRSAPAQREKSLSHQRTSPVSGRTGAASKASAVTELKDWDQELRWVWAIGAETADPGHRRRRVRDHPFR
jgi:hypothetical protein